MVLFNSEGNYVVAPQLPLSTKLGTSIPNEQKVEAVPAVMNARKEQVINGHPERRVRSLNSGYNCMGMMFASRRTAIDPVHLRMILLEDGYRRITDEAELQIGDMVVYRDEAGEVSHVGMVTEVRINLAGAYREVFVLSQWGQYGEYFHRVDDVGPWLGQPREYWTDRTEWV